MFDTVQETPYDLQFKLAGIPVRVSIWFWVAGCVLGFEALKAGAQFLIAWLLVLLISILVHEMGHALTARFFGHRPNILLYHFGGLAFYQPFGQHHRGKSILITLAGPAAGFLLFGIVLLLTRLLEPSLIQLSDPFRRVAEFTISQLLYINLIWGLVNLLPVLPLDGGQICREICSGKNPLNGLWYAAWVSAIVAGLAAVFFYTRKETYAGVFFAVLCMNNVVLIQQMKSHLR